jgi:hypothetical protein
MDPGLRRDDDKKRPSLIDISWFAGGYAAASPYPPLVIAGFIPAIHCADAPPSDDRHDGLPEQVRQ